MNVDDKPGSDDEGSLGGDQEAANRDTGATGVGSDSGGSLVDMASVENLPPGSFRYFFLRTRLIVKGTN